MERLHVSQRADAVILAPGQESLGRAAIGGPRVGVPDLPGEEFEEADSGPLAARRHQGRHDRRGPKTGDFTRPDRHQLRPHGNPSCGIT